ncbi:MAG: DinB family protein [Burkholderiaceae bacterium]
MSRMVRHFLVMARANRLANHRLDAACLTLTHDEWVAPRTSFFPSIAATLNHILVVDWYYLDALEDGGRGAAAFANEMPCATMADLAREQRIADERLIAFCAGLEDDALARRVPFDRGARGRPLDRIDRTLVHLFMHHTHHRGQVHAMLSGTSVAPPQLDEFLMETDAVFRTADMKAVGMTEADLVP